MCSLALVRYVAEPGSSSADNAAVPSFILTYNLTAHSRKPCFFTCTKCLRRRRLALLLLPDGDPTLIVRVLEAFMALQFQAGVLTEEMVLAVQGLVEVSIFSMALMACFAPS